MRTYQSRLLDGQLIKTVAVSPPKARAQLAHQLSFAHGHRKAYQMLGPVELAPRLEPFSPRRSVPTRRRTQVKKVEYPKQGVLDLNFEQSPK